MSETNRMSYLVVKYDMLAHQNDESYSHTTIREYELGTFDKLEEAQEAMKNEKLDDYAITRTPRGLDSVSYQDICILDLSGEEPSDIDGDSSLPPAMYIAMTKHQALYHAFLDHKREDYPTLSQCLESGCR